MSTENAKFAAAAPFLTPLAPPAIGLRLRVGTLLHLVLCGALLGLALASVPFGALFGTGTLLALAIYLAVAVFVLAGLRYHAQHQRFGLANGVTLMRAAVTAFLAALATLPAPALGAVRLTAALIGLGALLFDGVDGWAARRADLASAFGARFDMEVDALFALVLSVLVWESGQAGAWVLAIGAMRYIYIMAGWIWPALAQPPGPSLRRKTICVVTILALLAALSPALAARGAGLLCAGALALLVYSFGVDCVWLMRPAQRAKAPDPASVRVSDAQA